MENLVLKNLDPLQYFHNMLKLHSENFNNSFKVQYNWG